MDNCYLCGHLHDRRDMLIEVPNVCGWCADCEPCDLDEEPAAAQPHD